MLLRGVEGRGDYWSDDDTPGVLREAEIQLTDNQVNGSCGSGYFDWIRYLS